VHVSGSFPAQLGNAFFQRRVGHEQAPVARALIAGDAESSQTSVQLLDHHRALHVFGRSLGER